MFFFVLNLLREKPVNNMEDNLLLKLFNWSLVGCFLILSNFLSQANCCEEEKATSPYMLATGCAGQDRLEKIEEAYGHFSQSLLNSLPLIPKDGKILSVGCGTGTRECRMAQYWPHAHIKAIDNSEAQLMIARERASKLGLENIDFSVGDANNLPTTDGYDLVYARFLLTHVQNPGAVLKEMIRVAKPGALIVCEELSSSSHFCEPNNKYFEEASQLTQRIANKMRVDYDIGAKLRVLMQEQGLITTFYQHQPDRSNINVKMQLPLAISEAKPKLINAGIDEKLLDDLLKGMEEFATQEDSRASMSDLFQVVGCKPSINPHTTKEML